MLEKKSGSSVVRRGYTQGLRRLCNQEEEQLSFWAFRRAADINRSGDRAIGKPHFLRL